MTKVLIIGSSHVNRFEKFVKEQGLENFNIESNVDVRFCGISGGKITSTAHVNRLSRAIELQRPEFVIVQIGGNDIDSTDMGNDNVECVMLRLVNLCELFSSKYKLTRVFINQLLPRSKTRNISTDLYNEYVHQANKVLKREAMPRESIVYWKLKGFSHPTETVFADGVHMNQSGFRKYYRHIRGAILHGIGSMAL